VDPRGRARQTPPSCADDILQRFSGLRLYKDGGASERRLRTRPAPDLHVGSRPLADREPQMTEHREHGYLPKGTVMSDPHHEFKEDPRGPKEAS
jgi:hypothetical protein